MSKDLRLVFDGILKEWGHDVLLQRVVNPHASNENPKYLTIDGKSRYEIHTTRHVYPGSRALGSVAQEEMEGVLHNYELIYYFRHNVDPISGDIIYENLSKDSLFNLSDGKIDTERYPDLNMFVIDQAIPMRGKNGQIVFWVAGVTRDTD